jgi:hypothetical protein
MAKKLARVVALIIFLAAILTTACTTTLTTVPVTSKDPVSPEGVVYYLPRAVFEVSVTQELVNCRVVITGATLIDRRATLVLDVVTSADVTTHLVADTVTPYSVKYEALKNGLKATKATMVLYPNGTLKSVNVTIEDKTTETIANVVQTGIKIAALANGVPLPVAAVPDEQMANNMRRENCGSRALAALANVAQQEKILTDKKSTKEQQDKAKAVIALVKQQTLVHRLGAVVFAPDKGELSKRRTLIQPTATQVQEWLSPIGVATLKQQSDASADGTPNILVTELFLAPLSVDPPRDADAIGNGLVYRQPIQAELMVCVKQCADSTGQIVVVPADRVYSNVVSVPQFGVRATLPLTNKVFVDDTIVAEFAETGALTKLEFNTTAQAQRASAALLDTVKQVSEFQKSRLTGETEARKAKRQEELDRINHDKDVFDALQKREEARQKYEKALTGAPE